MSKEPTNWKKLHKQSEELLKHADNSFQQLAKLNDDLENRHKNLNLEFDKAVEINKKFQHTIIEQRGIINYLEGKINGN
jgi:serine phosphatase RsbU (regulator of sigma subunit)